MPAPLHAGVACVDITPPLGLDIAGHLWPRPALGTHDPLYCKALVLDDGVTRVALVALDLLGLERGIVLRARELIAAHTGIPPAHVLLACSHTHYGPATIPFLVYNRPHAYIEALPRRIAAAVTAAATACEPTGWGYAVGNEATMARYRRLKLRSGRVRNAWLVGPDDEVVGPAGEIDPDLPLLAIQTAAGRLHTLLVNHSCHVVNGFWDYWSASYPGELAIGVSRATGVDAQHVLYTAGAAGNIHPAEEDPAIMGAAVAQAAVQALDTVRWRQTAQISVRERALSLPARQVDRFPFEEIAEAFSLPRHSVPLDFGKIVRFYANEYVQLLERGQRQVETALQALAIDDLAIVAVPGELFVELGREIKRRSPYAQTIVISVANDYLGYIPHRAAFDEGGYETVFTAQSRLAPEAGEIIVEAALQLLQDMRGG